MVMVKSLSRLQYVWWQYTLRKVQKILLYALKSKNTFQSFNMEVYEKIFLSWILGFLSGEGKLLILQHIWLYIIISHIKDIQPTLRYFS